VLQRATALFLAGVGVWMLWMTADLAAAGQALEALGSSTRFTAALLTAELGRPPETGPLAEMTVWERLVIRQSALLSMGEEAVAALARQRLEGDRPDADPEDTAEVSTTSAPEDIVEKTLTGSESSAYVSADGVYVRNYTDREVDLTALESCPVTLTGGEEPEILIIHTHTTEAYTMDGTDIYTESSTARTTDNYYNMVRVGEEMAKIFREAGFSVVHDTGCYDYPEYNGAYTRSGASIQNWLEKYPSIRVVLDVHRDALIAEDGTVYKTAAELEGEKTAQCMLVVGTDAGGQSHPNWRQNLALALAVQHRANRDWPTLARPMVVRSSRFNQQLTPASLLVEVGSHGNTLQEALTAARLFAQSMSAVFQDMIQR